MLLQALASARSLASIAADVGASRQAASEWARGRALPGLDARARLEDRFAIPFDSWERPTEAPEPPAPAPPRASVAELAQLLGHLRDELRLDELTVRASLLAALAPHPQALGAALVALEALADAHTAAKRPRAATPPRRPRPAHDRDDGPIHARDGDTIDPYGGPSFGGRW